MEKAPEIRETQDNADKSFIVTDFQVNYMVSNGKQSCRMFIRSNINIVSYLYCCKELLNYL